MLHENWMGHQTTGARVAFLIRFGASVSPESKIGIQAGDQVYIAAIAGRAAEMVTIAALPSSEDLKVGTGLWRLRHAFQPVWLGLRNGSNGSSPPRPALLATRSPVNSWGTVTM